MSETKIKIQRGRRPTTEQIRTALQLAQSRGDDRIVLIDPGSGEIWGSASVGEVSEYIKKVDNVEWPFATNRRNKKVVIE